METAILVTIVISASSLLGYLSRLIFMSKCKNVSLCFGILKVERKTEDELKSAPSFHIKSQEKTENNNI